MNATQSTPTQMFPLDGGFTPITGEPTATEENYLRAYEHGRGLVASLSTNMESTIDVTNDLALGEAEDTLDNTPTFTPNFR